MLSQTAAFLLWISPLVLSAVCLALGVVRGGAGGHAVVLAGSEEQKAKAAAAGQRERRDAPAALWQRHRGPLWERH